MAPRGGDLVPQETTADIQRRELFRQPKDVFPIIRTPRAWYRNQDKQKVIRDLVVVDCKDAKIMLERARKVLSKGSKQQTKINQMMRHGRENWARDIVSERTRGGMRAFKYRSGMRDLRNEKKFRRVEQRLPDRYRKRHRWNSKTYFKRTPKWLGPNKYKK